MQPPNKPPFVLKKEHVAIGRVFLTLFLLPFIGVGAFVTWSGIRQLQQGASPGSALPLVIFGLVFLAIPLGILNAASKAMRKAVAEVEFRSQNMEKPWLWRREWAEGVLVDHVGGGSAFLMVLAIIFIAASTPILFVLRGEVERGNYIALIALIFPVVGAALLITGVYQLLRKQKYGTSILRVGRTPIEPGRPVTLDLQTHVMDSPESGFRVKLTCLRRRVTGAGRSRSVSESILWQDEQTIRMAAPTGDGMRLPITITIPGDAQPCDERTPDDRVIWRLDVSAEVPGIDYAAEFELPVFNTTGSPEAPREEAHVDADIRGWKPDPESLIVINPTVDGEEIHVRSHGRFTDILGIGVFNLFWFGFIALMLFLRAPFIFPFIFGAMGALLVAIQLDMMFGRTTIRASRSVLQVRRSWLGIGHNRSIDPSQIKSVTTKVGMTSGGGKGTPYYNVQLRIRNGSETTAAKFIRSRRDAEALATKIERDCGIEPESSVAANATP